MWISRVLETPTNGQLTRTKVSVNLVTSVSSTEYLLGMTPSLLLSLAMTSPIRRTIIHGIRGDTPIPDRLMGAAVVTKLGTAVPNAKVRTELILDVRNSVLKNTRVLRQPRIQDSSSYREELHQMLSRRRTVKMCVDKDD